MAKTVRAGKHLACPKCGKTEYRITGHFFGMFETTALVILALTVVGLVFVIPYCIVFWQRTTCTNCGQRVKNFTM